MLFDYNYRHRNDTVTVTKDHDKDKKKSEAVMAPMWLFLVSGPAIYVLLGLHILIDKDNTRHILHSIVSQHIHSSNLYAACIKPVISYSIIHTYRLPKTVQKKVEGLMSATNSNPMGKPFYCLFSLGKVSCLSCLAP